MKLKRIFRIQNLIFLFLSMATINAAASGEASFKEAVQLAQNNKVDAAIKIIDGLNNDKKITLNKNLMLLTLGRMYYQKDDLAKAVLFYDQVSKTSDYWAEAQEEKAWAFTRQNNYDKSLSALKSLFTSIFVPQIGPETYVLSAFVNYKICDYKISYQKVLDFKKQMLPRVQSLESIVETPGNDMTRKWLGKMDSQVVNSADLGKDISKMPRYFYRDDIILAALKNKNENAAYQRLKVLAKADLEEISKNLNKMKILEVEIIQRSFNYDSKTAAGDLKFDKRENKNTLIFPDEKNSSEVWIDEIGKYQVKSQKCPTSQGGHT